MGAYSTRFINLGAKSLATNGSVAIVGSNVTGLSFLKVFSDLNKQVTHFVDNFQFEGSDHHYMFIEDMVRQANASFYDHKLSSFFGWNDSAKQIDWSSMLSLYHEEMEKYKKMVELQVSKKDPVSQFNAQNHEYVFNCSSLVYKNEFSEKLMEIFGKKVLIDAHQFDKILDNKKPILVYANSPPGIELSLFLAQALNVPCAVIVPESISNKINDAIKEPFYQYLVARKVYCIDESEIANSAYKNNKEISDIINDAEYALNYSKFQTEIVSSQESAENSIPEEWKTCTSDFERQMILATKFAYACASNQNYQINPNDAYGHVFSIQTPLKFSSIGMPEDEIKKLDQSTIIRFNYAGPVLEHATTFGQMELSYILLTSSSDNHIINIQIFSPESEKIANSLMVIFKYGLKIGDLDENIGIHPTFIESLFSNLQEGAVFGEGAGCST